MRYEVPDEARTPDMSGYVFGDFDPTTIPGVGTEDGDGVTRISDLAEDFLYQFSMISSERLDGFSLEHCTGRGEIDNFDSGRMH